MRFQKLMAASALVLAACSQDAKAPADSEVDAASSADDETLSPGEPSLADATQQGPIGQANEIPAAMHGRWGLVAADCTSTRGDAKGLIEVGESEIQFYESVGSVDAASAQDNSTFRASFSFIGEGMEWTRDMQLSLSEDGNSLTRSEFGEDALAEPLTYTKCA